MDRKDLRRVLLDAAGFGLVMKGAFGKSKTLALTMPPGKLGSALTFKTLGTGSMKRVVRIENEDRVLALAGDSPAAE